MYFKNKKKNLEILKYLNKDEKKFLGELNKSSNNIKTIASEIFINIYEFSGVFKEEIVIFKKFRKERKINKQKFCKDEYNAK